LKDAGAEVLSFTRFEVGEGIEREEVDFAAEVAAQVGSAK
jgi:elongation factor Ts